MIADFKINKRMKILKVSLQIKDKQQNLKSDIIIADLR